jgi:hypothetical protein
MLDVYHALEYVWQVGTCLHAEGSPQLEQWYAKARAKALKATRKTSSSSYAAFHTRDLATRGVGSPWNKRSGISPNDYDCT